MSALDRPVVLVVEDEGALADLFTQWLLDDYEVRTAKGGEEALQLYSERVDVVLLDRRMPGVSGDEVLKEIRDRGGESGVAMVTAVEPDFDVVEMGFDAYLTKPIEKEELTSIVERLLTRAEYDREEQEYFSLVSKQVALRAGMLAAELEADSRYVELEERIEEHRSSLDRTASGMDRDDFHAAFHNV